MSDPRDLALLAEIRRHEATKSLLKAAEEVLKDCGIHSINFDTCGVCKMHFYECEAEISIITTGPGEMDGPRVFSCAGARARAFLNREEK